MFKRAHCTGSEDRKSLRESCGKVGAINISELSAAALFLALSASHVFRPPVAIEGYNAGP